MRIQSYQEDRNKLCNQILFLNLHAASPILISVSIRDLRNARVVQRAQDLVLVLARVHTIVAIDLPESDVGKAERN